MTADIDKHWTVADYLQFDDDQRYEIIEGNLWTPPAPTDDHQRIITRLGTFIDMHVLQEELGECRDAPFDVYLADDTVVQPDFTFVSKDRVEEVLGHRGAQGAPDMVIEVLSPSTASRDRLTKRPLYAKAGVRWLVLVDASERVVETFELSEVGEYVVRDGAAGDDSLVIGCFPDLEIDLAKVWPD